MHRLKHDLDGPVLSMSWAPNGTHLATLEKNPKSGQLALNIRSQADGKARQPQLPRGHGDPAGRLVARRQPDRAELPQRPGPRCSSTRTAGSCAAPLTALSGPVAWEPGGHRDRRPACAGVAIFDSLTGQRERTITGQEHKATAVSWATRGKVLLAGPPTVSTSGCSTRIPVRGCGACPGRRQKGTAATIPPVHYIGWLDSGRYLLEFRKHGAHCPAAT